MDWRTTAALGAVVAVVGSALLGLRMRNGRALMLMCSAGAAALLVLSMAGADITTAVNGAPSLLLVVGYSAVACVVADTGQLDVLARRVPLRPLTVFIAAAVLTVFTSNDVVIVVLAPLVISGLNPWRRTAALYAGANVTGLLLPQGSPTNVMIQNAADLDWWGYVRESGATTAVLFIAAAATVALILNRRSRDEHTLKATESIRAALSTLAVAAATLALQPMWAIAKWPTWTLGVFLLCGAIAIAARRQSGRAVLLRSAWIVIPAATAMSAAGTVFVQAMPHISGDAAAWSVFGLSGVVTDLAAAGFASGLVQENLIEPSLALASVSAGAFLSPVASLSGVLLLRECARAGLRPPARMFAWCAVISIAAMASVTIVL